MSGVSSISTHSPRVFIVNKRGLRGRLDAEYNLALQMVHLKSVYQGSRLRELVVARTGGTPSKANPAFWEAGTVPWASPKDFSSFFLTTTEDRITPAAVADGSTTVVPPNTLLVVFRSGVLRHSLPVTLTTTSTAINQDLKALQVCGGISSEYLGVYFEIFGRRLLPLITKSGATVQSINTKQFEEIEIPVPPDRVQKLVVERYLTSVSKAERVTQESRSLLSSIDRFLLSELGVNELDLRSAEVGNSFVVRWHELTGRRWDPNYSHQMSRFLRAAKGCKYSVKPLKEFISRAQYGISERATAEKVGIPMLRMLNIQDGEWQLDDLKYIDMKEEEKRPYVLNKGDILFNRTNSKELVGKCMVFDLDEEFVFASYLIRVSLREHSGLLPEFLVAYLSCSLGRAQIDAVSRQIAGMTNVNAEEIRDLLVPVPPLDVQHRVSECVARIRLQARDLRERAKAELEEEKQEIENIILGQGADA